MKHLIFPQRASLYRPLGSLLSHTSSGICSSELQSYRQGRVTHTASSSVTALCRHEL